LPDSDEASRSQIQGLQQQLDEQKQLLEEIKRDIQEVKGIVKGVEEARRPPPSEEDQKRTVSIDDDHVKGRPQAKLTLIEFSDFQCPFCERFYREALPQIEQEYIRTGKVRMVYRDFPLDNIHKDAQKAAEASQCAGEQGQYWQMHDMLFNNHKALDPENLKKYARGLGLSAERFDTCLDSGKYAEEVRKDFLDGQAAGVQGTPTFFVGYTDKGKTIQAIPIRGARPYMAFKQTFDELLQGK
jgi:protein-disulfide isomerase